jgi:amidophosphoribosyltransferase
VTLKVLIVSDRPDFRQLLAHHVTLEWRDALPAEYEPTTRGRLQPGFTGAAYDAVLLDQEVQGGRGLEWLEDLVERRDCPAIVYFASAAPPVRHPNVYGIDMPAASELVAAGRTAEEGARIIGADWLIYQDLEDLVRAVQHHDAQVTEFDTSCFSGQYVTGDITPEYLARLQAERSDLAKAERNAGGSGRGSLKVVGGL